MEPARTFSLLHDDIADGDRTRRGPPAVRRASGTGPAVLAGDALFALAVETPAAAPGTGIPSAARHLSAALDDLVRGQAGDPPFETRPRTGPEAVRPDGYRATAEHRTGALLGRAAALGAVPAGAPRETAAALDRAGRHPGVAFQVVDDLPGIRGDPAVTGRPVHADLLRGKKTFPAPAALRTPAARPLARLLDSAGPLDGTAARRAAALERGGGQARGRPGGGAPPHRRTATSPHRHIAAPPHRRTAAPSPSTPAPSASPRPPAPPVACAHCSISACAARGDRLLCSTTPLDAAESPCHTHGPP